MDAFTQNEHVDINASSLESATAPLMHRTDENGLDLASVDFLACQFAFPQNCPRQSFELINSLCVLTLGNQEGSAQQELPQTVPVTVLAESSKHANATTEASSFIVFASQRV